MANPTDIPFTDDNPIAYTISTKQSLNFIPDPPTKVKSKVQTWQHQMLIPFVVAGKLFAFHGPYQGPKMNRKAVGQYFPCFIPTIPSSFNHTKPIDVKFLVSDTTIFPSVPTSDNTAYLAWPNRIQGQRQPQWEKLGIFNVI